MSEAPRPRSRDCQSGWIHRSSEERTWCSDIMAWTTTCIRPVHRMGYFWPRGEKKFARTICVVQRGTSPAEIDGEAIRCKTDRLKPGHQRQTDRLKPGHQRHTD